MNDKGLEGLLKLSKNYERTAHLQWIEFKASYPVLELSKLTKIYSANWQDKVWLQKNELPYTTISLLLDSYYFLPERPDLSFQYIWQAVNHEYKKIYLKSPLNSKLTDSGMIDLFLKELNKSKYFRNGATGQKSILEIIKLYSQKIPIKTCKFITNYLLKGYVLDKNNISTKYNSSSYFTIKSNYNTLFDVFINTYGESFSQICKPTINKYNTDFELNIADKFKSKSIPDSMAKEIQKLIQQKKIELTKSKKDNKTNRSSKNIKEKKFTYQLQDDELVDFIFKIVIYSIRNNTMHGKIVPRLNSIYANEESYVSSTFLYLMTYLYLTILMLLNEEITYEEFTSIALENLINLK